MTSQTNNYDKTMAEHLSRSQWRANLCLKFADRFGRTALVDNSFTGPLRVQRPFYPEDKTCHAYIVHPPGGVVGGDTLAIDVKLTSHAHALITTPGAAKCYRSDGRTADISQVLVVGDDAVLEWLPLETIIFNRARVNLVTDIYLAKSARCIAWDIVCLGRPAGDEIFNEGFCQSRLRLYREDKLQLMEPLTINEQLPVTSSIGLRGFSCSAILVATGMNETLMIDLRAFINNLPNQASLLFGCTLLDDVGVIRVLAHQAQQVHDFFSAIWQFLRPLLLHLSPSVPRIWAT